MYFNYILLQLPKANYIYFLVVCFLAFDIRMNSFSTDERNPESKTSKLIESAEITNR